MIVGLFTKNDQSALVGDLPSIGFRSVSFEPVEKKGEGPDYRATIEGAEVGAAWKKKGDKGEYLSAKLDAPTFPAPVYVAIFKNEDGSYAVSWKRRKPEPQDEQETSEF